MWPILYVADDDVYNIGPFGTENEAMAAAKKANASGEFDIQMQNVYMVDANHELHSLEESDLQ